MKKISIVFGLCVFSLVLLAAAPAGAIPPKIEDYDVQPPLLLNAQMPAVLLLISKDQKMFMQAYSDTVDANGDGRIDIGFNPSIIYTGYFDPYSCYKGTSGTSAIGFARSGPAVPETAQPTLPAGKGFPGDFPVPRSATGICKGDTNWSGNWLNWFSTARIDAVRKVLYGGKRYNETPGKAATVLEAAYIQQNSHAWGNEVWSDDSWPTRASSSPYYDITNYAGVVSKPSGKDKAHFFGRSDIKLHVGLNVNTMPSTTANPEGRRIWDWASPESSANGAPNDSAGGVSGRTSYNLRLQACYPQRCPSEAEGGCQAGVDYEAGDYCRPYNDVYRPAGLLQKYSEDGKAMFGLMSGMFDNATRWDGGALRQNVQYLIPQDAGQRQINLDDGTFRDKSLMKIIDSYALSRKDGDSGVWESPSERIFGNPMGEMVYQGMLYFAGSKVFPDYGMTEKDGMTRVPWDSPLGKAGNECLRPVIMIISDIAPSHDMDMLPGVRHKMRVGQGFDASGQALTKGLYNPGDNNQLETTFHMEKFLEHVTDQEGYNKDGRTFYVANNNWGASSGESSGGGSKHAPGAGDENACTPKSITNLAQVRGMCPGEPQNYGGYSMVAAAYYGNTHKIFENNNVQTYAVAMASTLPELNINVEGKGAISFMPMAMAASSPNGTATADNAIPSGVIATPAINTYIMEWKTDSKGQPYRGSFFINFDDHLEGTGAYVDYDQDAPSRYYFNLIRPCRANECSSNGKLSVDDLKSLMAAGADGEQRSANAPGGANTSCGTAPCAYRNAEYVYRNWDYHRSPNYIKSNTDESFTGPPTIANRPDYKRTASGVTTRFGYTYGEVVDIYGHIGDPGTVYKKITDPTEISEAIGISLFVYTLGGTNNSYPAQVGYTISGTEKADGGYLEIVSDTTSIGSVANAPMGHKFNSPPTCVRSGSNVYPANVDQARPFAWTDSAARGNAYKSTLKFDNSKMVPSCGSPRLPLTATRLFLFNKDTSVKAAESLPNPLWLAAKYGGFDDYNRDGYPGTKGKPEDEDEYGKEWQGADGNPKTYFFAANLNELKDQLDLAFTRIMNSMATGTPNASSINSVLGGGLAIRTYYYGEYKPSSSSPAEQTINWIGGAYSLFVDPWGNLREDSNHNGKLDLACGFAGETSRGDSSESGGGDWIVQFVTASDRPRADLYRDSEGTGLRGTNPIRGLALESVRVLWDLGRNLAVDPLDGDAISTPRASYAAKAEYPAKRRVYYHFDQGGSKPGGLSDDDLFLPSKAGTLTGILLQENQDAAAKLIRYILGQDQPGFRNRTTASPWDGSIITWRLGDVINSQPIIVGPSFSRYDHTYRDQSYAEYTTRIGPRRQVAYFGANDGMLHAVNLGFFGSLADGRNIYQVDPIKPDPDVSPPLTGHELGQELWAFIPQAVLPHLQWLADETYGHSYFVDMRPTVVEMKLKMKNSLTGETTREWRTVLITNLRLGGRSIELTPQNGDTPATYSHSEVFAMDITDPEKEPVFLWRFSAPDLGMVVARPSVVNNAGDWYVILGSGPTFNTSEGATCDAGPAAYGGMSNQRARLFVLDASTGEQKTQVGGGQGYLEVPAGYEASFFSESFTLLAPTLTVKGAGTPDTAWTNPLAYFSLIQAPYTQVGDNMPRKGFIDRGGIWRLQMAESNGTALKPEDWKLDVFYDARQPVNGSVNATYDAKGQLWVLFGTGRLWSNDDTRPCQNAATASDLKLCAMNHLNYIYGLKEPMNEHGQPLFQPVDAKKIQDVSNVLVYPDPDSLETLDGKVAVQEKDTVNKNGYLISGVDVRVNEYSKLAAFIAGPDSSGYRRALTAKMPQNTFVDPADLANPAADMSTAWWKNIGFEMNLYRPALNPLPGGGSHMAFTTYEPTEKLCGAIGKSYLYLVDTFTGLPRPFLGQYQGNNDWDKPKSDGAVSDHLEAEDGLSSAAQTVKSGTRGNITVNYQTNNQDQTQSSIPELLTQNLQSGIISWREVLDMGLRFATESEAP